MSLISRKRLWLLVLVPLLVFAIADWLQLGKRISQPLTPADSARVEAPVDRVPPPAKAAVSADVALSQHNGSDQDRVAKLKASPMTVSLADFLASERPELSALSPEEAAWLRKHGYPTVNDLQQASSLSERDLWQRAKSGDLVADALLGQKYLGEGDARMAAASFSAAAQHGSLYAREQAAIVNRGRNPDPALAHEYVGFALEMEIARIFGDHRVDAIIRRELPVGAIDANVRAGVLHNLSSQLQLIAEDAKLRGVPPQVPDPRPNADIWAQIDAGTVTEVTVYPRPDMAPGGP